MTILAALAVGLRLSLTAVGGTDDLRSIQNPTWWEQVFSWFLTIPAWLPVGAFFFFAGVLAIQLALDAGEGRTALKNVKASTDRAWGFQEKLDAVLDKLESLSTELKASKEEYEKTAGNAESKADAVASRMNQFEDKVEQGVKTIAELDIKIQNRIYEELPKEIKDIAGDSETWSGLWAEHTGELHEVRERLSKVESHLPQSPPGTEEETPQ